MRRKLFTIEASFNISGREAVVVGELEDNAPSYKIGSLVTLVQPNGNELVTEVSGIELIKPIDYENFNRKRVGVMLKDTIKKEDIPVGTEVFLNA